MFPLLIFGILISTALFYYLNQRRKAGIMERQQRYRERYQDTLRLIRNAESNKNSDNESKRNDP